MGRSLGSGPATHLAAKYNPGCLALVSPYTSIKSVAQTKVGFLSGLLAQQFDNLSKIHQVTCPTFIVHGQKDVMIPVEHAYELQERCFGPCTFITPEAMTHNRFDVYDDVIKPLTLFLVDDVYSNSDDEYDDDNDEVGPFGQAADSLNHQYLKSVHRIS